MNWFLAMFLVLALSLVISIVDAVLRGRVSNSLRWVESEGMPLELQLARLIMSETPVSTLFPRPLHGTPDQVFMTRKGKLVLVDTKVRRNGRVKHSDIIQLGVYRIILSQTRREPIARHGYIRVVQQIGTQRRVSYRRVNIPSAQSVLKLANAA